MVVRHWGGGGGVGGGVGGGGGWVLDLAVFRRNMREFGVNQ